MEEQYKWNYDIKVKTKEGIFEYEDKLENIDSILERQHIKQLLDLITNLQNQLQQKETIIKEAREYIEHNLYGDYGYECKQSKKDLLQILDKETKNENI